MHRSLARLLLLAVLVGLALPASVAAAPMSDPATPDAAPAGSTVPARVVSHRSWIHAGRLVVAGEIENTSSSTINGFVTIGISPGPSGGDETLSGTVAFESLAPGGRSPFLVVRDPYGEASATVTFITAGGYPVGTPGHAIGISQISPVGSDPALVGGTGDSVTVQVRNGTSRPVRLLGAFAGFRSAAGRVSNLGHGLQDVQIPAGGMIEGILSGEASGVLATSATVDVNARFDDGAGERVVSWGNWFRDLATTTFRADIAWLAEQGITGGCASHRYCPNDDVTRAQMAIFLDRALDLPPTGTDYFDDDDGKTGEASIDRMAAEGITGGCGTRRFCPGAPVTRGQMAAFLARAFSLPSTTTDYFTDDDTSTFEASINRVAKAGITGGCGGGKYCPLADVTRGQMAAFLRRALQ